MRAAAIIAHKHHEKWDGTGYPNGISGEISVVLQQ
ncbi:HD domain-containing phosphohydrolase [Psychrobacillus sp.]|nr:HD domain-containing phosphohydrolase [Psychrobacillus sp.]